eukprot:XP_001699443.1 predicted protein [Chlamydomonas reinhardtii]
MAYSFTRVFEGSDQEEFYGTAIEPLLEELVGLRTGSSVFMLLEERGKEHQVQLCFYEVGQPPMDDKGRVYENRVYDLLQSARLGKRQAQHLPIQVLGANCCVPGLLRCHCTAADAGQRLYAAASRIRTQSATHTNSESSRSHAVFTGRSATLSLVDLAGAERAGRTKNVGSKLRESANINTSLSVLGRCLEALRHNQALAARGPGGGGAPRVIPVRESSLTSLFKVRGCTSAVAAAAAAAAAATRSCLSAPVANMRLNYDDTGIGVVNLVHLPAQGVLTGQGNLVLSVHLSQHGDEYDTNRHTLRFGALASRLQMAAAAPAAAPPQPPAGLPPLPPSQQQQQQSTQGRAKRQRVQPAFEEQPPIAEAPEEGVDEEPEPDTRQLKAVAQGEVEARAAAAVEAEAGPDVQGGGVDVNVVEALRAQVQQLQQQLVVVEETARAAAVAEWEELVASGRDELEEARQRAEQLEEQLAAAAKELAAAQREAAALRRELAQERAARPSREEALEERMVEPRAAAGGSQDPVAGQARAPAAGAEQHPEAGRHPPGTEAPAQGDDAPGTSGRRAEEERAPLAALPSSGNQQQPHQPAGGASAGRAGAAGGGSTGRPRGSSKRTGAGAAAGEGAPGRVAHAAEGTSATGTADPPQQGTGRHGHTCKAEATGRRSKRRRATEDCEVDEEAAGKAHTTTKQAHTAGAEELGADGGAGRHAGQGQAELDGTAGDDMATADAGKTPVAGRTRRKRQGVRKP